MVSVAGIKEISIDPHLLPRIYLFTLLVTVEAHHGCHYHTTVTCPNK